MGRRAAKIDARQALLAEIDQKRPKAPPVGSVTFDERMLRKAFVTFDLDKNDMVGAKELRHIFSQLGENPRNEEIDGMIRLCDEKGQGQVAFEDFLAIFCNPSEALRSVDVEALKEAVKGIKREGSEESSEQDDYSSGSDSSEDE